MGRVAIVAASVLLLVSYWAFAEALGMHPQRRTVPSFGSGLGRSMQQGNDWEERWYEQTLDHFTSRNATFQQRYMFAAQYWKGPQTDAPIFVLLGDEVPIDGYAEQHGFIWDIAPSFGALLVFPEHRYYGESLPFGNRTDSESLTYLSTEQALADYIVLISDLKQNLSAEASPVVLFGCSYGGMLASWFRLKYPHIAIGAIASSAPILQFEDSIPSQYSYYDAVSKDFRNASESCYQTFKNSLNIISNLSSPEELSNLTVQFGLCSELQTTDYLVSLIQSACSEAAMFNYPPPEAAPFGYPGYFVNEMCKALDHVGGGSNGLAGVAAAMNVYYNYTSTPTCHPTQATSFKTFKSDKVSKDSNIDPNLNAWWWQTCTEIVSAFGSRENTSMFPPYEWKFSDAESWCLEHYGVKPRRHWIVEEFGGQDIGDVLKGFGSNIVFANGLVDPYSTVGVLNNISESIVALVTNEGAHCLDSTASTPEDPAWLVEQRLAERDHIQRWLTEYYSDRNISTSMS